MRSNIEVVILNIKLNSIAHQRESTLNVGIICWAIHIIMALINKRNSPSVKTVNGMVNTTNIGFKKVFKNDNTMASIKAVIKGLSPSRCTPGSIYEAIITATAEINICTKTFIPQY